MKVATYVRLVAATPLVMWEGQGFMSSLVNPASRYSRKRAALTSRQIARGAQATGTSVAQRKAADEAAFEEEGRKEPVLDVAIVGAGPAGLATAVGLQAKGLNVKVFEAAEMLSERGAAVFLQAFGLVALDEIKPGLAAEAVAVGRQVDFLNLTRPSGETIMEVPMTQLQELVGYPFLGISRYALQRVLYKHLDEGSVEFGARLHGLQKCDEDGTTELSFEGGGLPVRAKAVIGADGRRSAVRKKVLAAEERNCNWALTWWALADVPEPVTQKGEFRMSYSTKKAIYYGEVQEGVTMWSFTCWREGEIERNPELRAAQALEELEGWPEELRHVVRSTSPNKIIEVYVGDSPLSWDTWSRQPGVTLMGDAAHAMLPTLAMGVTSALQDAATLNKQIKSADVPLVEALVQYEKARRIPATMVQLLSRLTMVFIENILCR